MAAGTSKGVDHEVCELQYLPLNQGLAIYLHDPRTAPSDESDGCFPRISSSALDSLASSDASSQNSTSGEFLPESASLKLQPQEDANLSRFHPNIYVPKVLLDTPEHLVKHGGGGSGVTVFGGYHPQFGSLVMKHGGHKDLIELVSLAKIERELSVRGNFKIDLLEKEKGDRFRDGEGERNISGNNMIATAFGGRRLKPNTMQSTMALIKQKSTAAITQITRLTSDVRFGSLDAMLECQNERDLAVNEDENDREGDEDFRIQAVRNAMHDMQKRIPAFRMVYISPMHLRCRQEELCHNTYRTSRITPKQRSSLPASVGDSTARIEADKSLPRAQQLNGTEHEMNGASIARRHTSGGRQARTSISSVCKIGRRIDLFGSDNTSDSFVHIKPLQVDLCFGGSYCLRDISGSNIEDESSCNRSGGADGYTTLMNFVEILRKEQEEREWKFTLAQQTIGQSRGIDGKMQSAPTASSLLAQGKLKGPLLQKLIDSQIEVIRNLQLLTMPEEMDSADAVRDEYEKIVLVQASENRIVSAEEVSRLANDFVGKAIHKNFHSKKGRFAMLVSSRDVSRRNEMLCLFNTSVCRHAPGRLRTGPAQRNGASTAKGGHPGETSRDFVLRVPADRRGRHQLRPQEPRCRRRHVRRALPTTRRRRVLRSPRPLPGLRVGPGPVAVPPRAQPLDRSPERDVQDLELGTERRRAPQHVPQRGRRDVALRPGRALPADDTELPDQVPHVVLPHARDGGGRDGGLGGTVRAGRLGQAQADRAHRRAARGRAARLQRDGGQDRRRGVRRSRRGARPAAAVRRDAAHLGRGVLRREVEAQGRRGRDEERPPGQPREVAVEGALGRLRFRGAAEALLGEGEVHKAGRGQGSQLSEVALMPQSYHQVMKVTAFIFCKSRNHTPTLNRCRRLASALHNSSGAPRSRETER